MAGRWIRGVQWGLTLALVAGAGAAVWQESRTSGLQAETLARFGRDLTWTVEPGANPDIRFPDHGPYDQRLGYTRLGGFIERTLAGPFRIEAQAKPTTAFRDYVELGGFAPFPEKSSAGLAIRDRAGTPLFSARYPERVYAGFEDIPKLIVDTLLFIENRELLDDGTPTRNPAVEWDRFALALASIPLKFIDPDSPRAGGSTLATQIEKFRHSPEGRTAGGTEKLRQMMSASVRAYLDGPDTTVHRRRIVVDYLNSTPLSARPVVGEINGLGDGLWAWFGTDFRTANAILRTPPRDEDALALKSAVYKQVLALLLAQRRPSHYLIQDRKALDELANEHLRVLERNGVIDGALADAAKHFPLRFRPDPPEIPEPEFVEQKAVNAIRNRLVAQLNLGSLYELDRLDLSVETTLDGPAQERVTQVLKRLSDPAATAELGLVGERLLGGADPAKVVYSVTVYERAPTANLVRVQVDTLDKPLDINEGAKLDLGSTAKLRALVSYLEVVARLHERYVALNGRELDTLVADAPDPLTAWVALTMARGHEATGRMPSLQQTLDLAMQRTYAASPDERFFTGGGLHAFANFDDKDDGRIMTIAEAFRHSVNLPFIRLMRDVVNHYIAEGPARRDDLLDDPRHPIRQMYLARFADQEGRDFLNRFWNEYRGLDPDKALDKLARPMRGNPIRLAVAFRAARPNATEGELGAFLTARMPAPVPPARLSELYAEADPKTAPLLDQGKRAGVHPLELWLVAYLQETPQPKRRSMLEESAALRQDAYGWLFQSRSKQAQDSRIGIMLEEEAFDRLHGEWRRLGYPFESLVASYATAIGSSADRPGALADLMGILLNDGVRLPTTRVMRMHFADGTPYETLLGFDDTVAREEGVGRQVVHPEVARTVRRHLADIVENGTARRVRGAFRAADGQDLVIGGKTGTGDHRFERFGPGGQLLESRVVGRTATFVFYLGDRWFGVVTAHVQGPQAADYHFTSALPAQLLKSLAPALQPLVSQGVQTAERS